MNFNFRKSNKTQRNRNRQVQQDYQKLEPRCLLAVEVGLNFTGTVEGVETVAPSPDIAGAIGPDHVVEMVNTRFTVYDKITGTEVMTQSLDEFWVAAGADLDFSTTSAPRLVYDPAIDRFFATSRDEGLGNTIYVGVSATNDPTGAWNSVQFQGDTPGTQLAVQQQLSVDANGVYITSNNVGSTSDVSLFSIPKTDLIAEEPSIVNITKFEGLDRDAYGTTLQVALDYNENATRAIMLGASHTGGTELFRTDIAGSFGPAANIAPTVSITVPEYMPAPGARQPSGVLLDNITPDISANVIRNNGSLWAVHTVEGSDNNSAIRWYRINEADNSLTNWGTLEDASEDYTNPSIAVNDFGVITIGYTVSGPTQFPSAEVIMGYTNNGLTGPEVSFELPETLRNGLADLEFSETQTNFWGAYSSTQVDPTDPFSFWTFQEYSFPDNHWGTRIAESGLIDLEPTLRGDAGDNVVIVKVSEQNPDWIEVSFDGVVTDIFENRGLTTLNIDGLGGDDVLVLDYANGDPNPNTGITFRGGDGFDTLEVVNGTEGNDWVINDQYAGFLDTVTRFRAVEQIEGSGFADTFLVQNDPGDMTILGGAGPDFFDVTRNIDSDVTIVGGIGDDEYRISLLNISNLTITDSIGSETDRLDAIATPGDDVIDLDGTTLILNDIVENGFEFPGIEILGIDGLGGNDQFLIRSTLQTIDLFGSAGDDEFWIGSAVPESTGDTNGIFETLNIDGGINNNTIVVAGENNEVLDVKVTVDTLYGFTDGGFGTINYVATDGSFAGTESTGPGIQLVGSNEGDLFKVESLLATNSLGIEGRDGIDRMEVYPNVEGNVTLDGQEGTDVYRATLLGITDRIIRLPDTGSFLDRDRVEVGFTEGPDDIRFADGIVKHNAEELIYGFPNEALIVNTMGGDDTITMGLNKLDFVRLMTGDGNDTVNINGSRGIAAYRIELGAGDDTMNMNSTSALTFFGVVGEDGDDVLNVTNSSFGDTIFDGGEHSDTVHIDNIGRTNRYISTRDSGVEGEDTVNVMGVEVEDRFVLRPDSVTNRKEIVVFDENTENLNVHGGAGADIVEVFGTKSPATRVTTGGGADRAFINRTIAAGTLILDTGASNDNVVVRATDEGSGTYIYTQSGDDTISVGSTTGENFGDLSKISGVLRLFGGASAGEDRLFVNDRGAVGDYGYYVTPNGISTLGGMSARDGFRGIIYDQAIEFVRVDGTDQDNFFSVVPGTTRFHIDGNLENSRDLMVLNGGGDGRMHQFGGESGRFTFTNGFGDVSYEEIEGAFSASQNSQSRASAAMSLSRFVDAGDDDDEALPCHGELEAMDGVFGDFECFPVV